jgi:uncharacterized membrane protein
MLVGDRMTTLAFIFHIGAGTLALISGAVAIFVRKGGRLHRTAGTVFFFAMLVMAVFAGYLAVVRPGQIVNLFISIFTLYLVVTGWLTVQRKDGETGAAEKAALAVAILLSAPFVILSFQLAFHLPLLVTSAVPLKGPVLVAIYGFTAVLVIAAIGDARVAFGGGIAGAPRIARHLWRMCVGLTLATGSAFTNGLARFLPGPYHVPLAFFLPQFVPLALLIYWMVRVRFTDWFRNRPAG